MIKENKFNNYKIFFAEKYGDGDFNNFLKKYNNNKINKLMIENELAILSKMVKYNYNSPGRYTDKIPTKRVTKNNSNKILILKLENNKKNIKRKSIKKENSYITPKSQENYRKIIKGKFLDYNNPVNVTDNNIIFIPQKYNTNNNNIIKFKPFINSNEKNIFKFRAINSANKTFEV